MPFAKKSPELAENVLGQRAIDDGPKNRDAGRKTLQIYCDLRFHRYPFCTAIGGPLGQAFPIADIQVGDWRRKRTRVRPGGLECEDVPWRRVLRMNWAPVGCGTRINRDMEVVQR